MTAPERVAEAAVRVRDRVFAGMSHKVAVVLAAQALDLAPLVVWNLLTPDDQGFTTTAGRFISRAEAWKLAKRAGQLRWDTSRQGVVPELHSEDMR